MSKTEEINSVIDLEAKMSQINIPWDEIAPEHVHEWLDLYAKSNGTCAELLLAGMLPCSSSLLGNSTVKLFDSWKEKGNLFVVGLAPSGAGKTPACNIGCVTPLISHLEPRIDENLLVDETSSNGLFNHFVNRQKRGNQVHVPLLCIDEGFTFLNKLTSTSKSVSQTSLTMERMCKLYDGDYWYAVKGSQGKRVGVQSARMSMATFTTPRRFLTEVWPRVVASRNGLADRILILYKNPSLVDIEVMEECSAGIQESALKGLGTVYEQIYNEHHQELPIEYTLNPLAREEYIKYCKRQNDAQESPSLGHFRPECNAKTSKNALRLALNLHVLWHRLGMALDHMVGPTPTTITEKTMNMALTLHDTLLSYGGIAEACLELKQGTSSIKMAVSEEDIKKRILMLPGPYTTLKRVYNSYSSSSRPSPQTTEACMKELESDSLGALKKVQKSTYFYKVLPTALTNVQHQKLGVLNISAEQYESTFLKKDDLLTCSQADKMSENHPNEAELRNYILDKIIQA